MGNYEASWAVRYVVMTASLGCSLLTSAVVLVEQLYRDTFPQLILIVQLQYTTITLLQMFFPAYYQDHLACELIGYVILSLWISSFTLTLLLLFIIERRLSVKGSWLNTIHKRWTFLVLAAIALPSLVNLIPIRSFVVCGLGDLHYYCSLCSRELSYWLSEFTMTVLILCFALFLFWQMRKHKKSGRNFGNEQLLALKVVSIPQVNFIILLLNLLSKTIDYSREPWLFWIYVVVNLLFYIVPIVNLQLFVSFMKGYPCTIYHFTWLIRKKPDSQLLASAYVEM